MQVPGGLHQPADHALQRVPQQQHEVDLRAAGPVHQDHGGRVAGVLLRAVNEISRKTVLNGQAFNKPGESP